MWSCNDCYYQNIVARLLLAYILSAVYVNKIMKTPLEISVVQSNLYSSNTDDSFLMANSNSVLSPYEIRPMAKEKKYLGKFSYFIMTFYVVRTH